VYWLGCGLACAYSRETVPERGLNLAAAFGFAISLKPGFALKISCGERKGPDKSISAESFSFVGKIEASLFLSELFREN